MYCRNAEQTTFLKKTQTQQIAGTWIWLVTKIKTGQRYRLVQDQLKEWMSEWNPVFPHSIKTTHVSLLSIYWYLKRCLMVLSFSYTLEFVWTEPWRVLCLGAVLLNGHTRVWERLSEAVLICVRVKKWESDSTLAIGCSVKVINDIRTCCYREIINVRVVTVTPFQHTITKLIIFL